MNIEKDKYDDGFWMGILEDTPQFVTQTLNTFLIGQTLSWIQIFSPGITLILIGFRILDVRWPGDCTHKSTSEVAADKKSADKKAAVAAKEAKLDAEDAKANEAVDKDDKVSKPKKQSSRMKYMIGFYVFIYVFVIIGSLSLFLSYFHYTDTRVKWAKTFGISQFGAS